MRPPEVLPIAPSAAGAARSAPVIQILPSIPRPPDVGDWRSRQAMPGSGVGDQESGSQGGQGAESSLTATLALLTPDPCPLTPDPCPLTPDSCSWQIGDSPSSL